MLKKGIIIAIIFSVSLEALPHTITSPVILNDSMDLIRLHGKMEVLKDFKKIITIDQIFENNDQNKFEYAGDTDPNYGYEDADYWFRFHVINQSSNGKKWLLQIGNPLIDSIEFYIIYKDQVLFMEQSGDLHPFTDRYINYPTFLFPLRFSGRDSVQIYLRFKGDDNKSFPLKIYEANQFYEESRKITLFFGGYFGVIAALILYNLFVYFSTKSRIYLYYAIFVFHVLMIHLSLNGYSYSHILTPWTKLANISNLLAIGLSTFFGAKFIRHFLFLRKRQKLLSYFLTINEINGVVLLGLCFLALSRQTVFLSTVKFAFYTTIFFSLSVMVVGIIMAIKKHREAKFLMIAWTVLLVGIAITALKFSGLVPDNLFTHHAAQIGSMFEVLLLSLALADRLKILEKERDLEKEQRIQALEEKEQFTQQQNIILEDRVIERTRELEKSLRALTKKNTLVESLLKELNHRVKNNLQVISSLLNLQANRLNDPGASEALRHGKNRINSIAMIHRKLYQHDDFEHINLSTYIDDLCEYMVGLYLSDKKVVLEKDVPDILVDIDTAVPLGLILNEILTNTFKYAFSQSTNPRITIKAYKNTNVLDLEVSDNGVGFPDKALTGEKKNFGFELIETLVDQLNGSCQIYNKNGANFKLKLTISKDDK